MNAEERGKSILGTNNYVWLKEYMAPVRERVESRRALEDARDEMIMLKYENLRLRQRIDYSARENKPVASFFRRYLPQLF